MKRIGIALGGLLLVAIGCTATAPDEPQERTGEVSARLTALASCAEVEAAIRASALREMNKALDTIRDSFLENIDNCGYGYGAEDDAGAASNGSSSSTSGAPPSPGQEKDDGASQVSGTNNQVAGVDEADFIKNDNKYLYVVAGGALRIIDAWPAEQAHVVAKVPIEGEPRKLFVAADRALVYSATASSQSPGSGGYPDGYGGGECTYGYDCDFTGDGTSTLVSVYDIANRAAPKLLRQIALSGSFINSRRIGTSVHTVLHDGGVAFPDLQYYPNMPYCGQDLSEWQIYAAFENLRAHNTAIIQGTDLKGWLPSIVDSAGGGNALASCQGFYNSPLGDGSGFITVLSLDMGADAGLSTSTILSRPGAAYASAEALYLSVRQQATGYGYWYPGMAGIEQASTVHKFTLQQAPAAASYTASGVVKGAVLNQFAMDEYEHHLRIATTTGHVPDPNVHSTLTVLVQKSGELVPTGMVDHIAPEEDIRSVRFAGDRGFVVTFKKTDPLFVLDLADPTKPMILAELKIPGFSTYMHMMDTGHLLTIGFDASDQGDFAWFTGVLLQIFDVSQPASPSLMHKEVIGTRGSSSEALNNHLAFNYFAPKNLLSLPMTICENGGQDGQYGDVMTFSGLMVYDTTVKSGFDLRGKVEHPPGDGYDAANCGNWWANATSQVKRSIIMDDYVFSVALDLIKVSHLDHLGDDLAAIPLGD
ncbi:MAG: beta-propeller domain-containing protein [Deltaproteobacteria bacterium]|nr:beta-propeller domain-containing protein [Deltaproteobacteria bacterium]